MEANSPSRTSYFNREYIKAFAEDEPARAKFINFGVLERYVCQPPCPRVCRTLARADIANKNHYQWAVGGVRIEDMILVKSDGYEIISSAPKGAEALRIING